MRLDGVVKRFGSVVAVDGVDLEVREGEFFSMLGPSGSGKTTTLRMIAGFEDPTSGTIELAGEEVGGTPETSTPASSIVPAVGSSNPAIIRSVVVLPEPEGPSMVKNSPRQISRSTPSTAVTSP